MYTKVGYFLSLGMDALTAEDVAETILFVSSRKEHVQIASLLILPTAQGDARSVYRWK